MKRIELAKGVTYHLKTVKEGSIYAIEIKGNNLDGHGIFGGEKITFIIEKEKIDE